MIQAARVYGIRNTVNPPPALSRFQDHSIEALVASAPIESRDFFFNGTATTEIYTLSLHDALPRLSTSARRRWPSWPTGSWPCPVASARSRRDRKSTRLNSSHGYISYAVFCLKKKKTKQMNILKIKKKKKKNKKL